LNISIVYFSQTGNTKKVAKILEKTFKDAGHQATAWPMMKNPPRKFNNEIIGIGAPCYACQAPTPVKEYIRSLEEINGMPAFVFATAGGSPGRVLYDMTRLLWKKGANVIGGLLIRGQVSHPGPSIYGRFPGRPNEEDLARAHIFAVSLLGYLSSPLPGQIAGSRTDAFKGRWGFYDMVAKSSSDSVIRFLMPVPQLSPEKCDHCNLCIKKCPMHNIVDEGYPRIGKECIRCYICQTGCPNGAFGSKWHFGDIILKMLYNPRFEYWFGDLQRGEKIY
jgi:flavodoxin/Pyruvate/2-oxoacid:ferredoxin oxidoreductase delta subunit